MLILHIKSVITKLVQHELPLLRKRGAVWHPVSVRIHPGDGGRPPHGCTCRHLQWTQITNTFRNRSDRDMPLGTGDSKGDLRNGIPFFCF